MFPYLISITILSLITEQKESHLRKMYAQILENDSIPLREIPFYQMEKYIKEYPLRARYVDIDLIKLLKNEESPYLSPSVKAFYERTEIIREVLSIQNTYSANRTVTKHLMELSEKYQMSYRTLMRERSRFMHHTSLMNLLSDPNKGEDVKDRYRTCCFYCRDYIIARHENTGRPSNRSIFRETRNLSDYKCSECPYHPEVKNGQHKKDDCVPKATCKRKREFMLIPNSHDTVDAIIKRIPRQETYMAWAGVKAWKNKCQHTTQRIKPQKVNYCWFSDHTCLDIIVKTKTYNDGHFDTGRIWLTGIMDAASDALIGYVLSTNPNSELIAHAFSTASAFKPDSPFHGICQYWYCDNGKDYRSKLMKGHPNNGKQPPLFLNKEFCESGFLEWLGITAINAKAYNGRTKPIERVWGVIEKEFISKMQGYCGSNQTKRPATLNDDIKKGNLYTFEQFADIFAEKIYPGYNNFKIKDENLSPMERYLNLEKVDTIVPSWRTLSILKKKRKSCAVFPEGIHYGTQNGKPIVYWHPALAHFIKPQPPYERVQVYAFDEPFNRSIAVVYGQVFICEAHPVEGLNIIEDKRHRVIQHLMEQNAQLKTYSEHIKQIHKIVIQNNLIEKGSSIPAIDNVAYGQTINEEKDKTEATDDPRIPEELKDLAAEYKDLVIEKEKPDLIGTFLKELGRKE